MTKKGISLPIEMIIIIAIAVLVLVVLAAVFMKGTEPIGQTSDSSAFADGCNQLKLNGCKDTLDPANINIDGYIQAAKTSEAKRKSSTGTLLRACYNLGRVLTDSPDPSTECRKACGCSI